MIYALMSFNVLINSTVTHRRCSSPTGQRSGHPIGGTQPRKVGKRMFPMRPLLHVRHIHIMGGNLVWRKKKKEKKEKKEKKREEEEKRNLRSYNTILYWLPMTQPTATAATQFQRREHLEKAQTTLAMFFSLSATSTIVRVMPQCGHRKKRYIASWHDQLFCGDSGRS